MKPTYFKLYDLIYGVEVSCFFNCDQKYVNRKMFNTMHIDTAPHMRGTDAGVMMNCILTDHSRMYILWLEKWSISYLVHACYHLCRAIFRHHDIKNRRSTDEPFAYYIEFWVKSIMKKYTEKNKIKPNKFYVL
jgi:hypothetical protein